VSAAGRQYGAYFSFEPAGACDEHGVIARIYNATASGAKGLHYYFPNLFATEQAHANFVRFGSQFRQRKPLVEVAVYYPETHIRLNGNEFLGVVQHLREYLDFDYMSDGQIRDGGLAGVRALLLVGGTVSESETWDRIQAWVQNGGLLIAAEEETDLLTVEGQVHPLAQVAKGAGDAGSGRALLCREKPRSPGFGKFAAEQLAAAPELSPITRAAIAADGQEDRVFVTACEPNELLWLNYSDKTVERKAAGQTVELPAWSIVSQTVELE
jgi:hypothetical protein